MEQNNTQQQQTNESPGFMSQAASATSNAVNATTSKIVQTETTTILKVMRVFNCINGLLMIANGVYAFVSCHPDVPSKSAKIIAFHSIAFGLLLFLFELPMGSKFDVFVRKNFGFMYSFGGKTMLLAFLSTLSFSLWNCSDFLPKIVGILTFVNSLFNCFVIYKHPGVSKSNGDTKYTPPTVNQTPPPAGAGPFSQSEAQAANMYPQPGTDPNMYGAAYSQGNNAMPNNYGGAADNGNVFAQQQETYTVPDVSRAGRQHDTMDDNPFAQSASDNPFADSTIRDVL